MREVVVIGGGLTGLAAAYTLDQLGIGCTLIEVKPRLGGSLGSTTAASAIVDFSPMAFTDVDFLQTLGLADAVRALDSTPTPRYAFAQGSQTLIDTLAAPFSDTARHSLMMRMAVSTLGDAVDTNYSICMENGMLLDAKSLIVTVPARYAERVFYTLAPEISLQLLPYRYDAVAHLSLLYPSAQLPDLRASSVAMTSAMTYIQPLTAAQAPARVPQDHVLVQIGYRMPSDLPPTASTEAITAACLAALGWTQPIATFARLWTESDPAMWRDPTHAAQMHALQQQLPAGIALAGSDYLPHAPTLQSRFDAGCAAARKIAAWLATANA